MKLTTEGNLAAPFVTAWGLFRRETKSWGILFGQLFIFFVLVTAITNLAYGLFGFKLLPIFENTLEDIRHFVHGTLELLVYWPLNWVSSSLAKVFFGAEFILPKIPSWFYDLALFSMILSRAERAAMMIAQPITGDTIVQRSLFERLMWGVILLAYVPTKAIVAPLRKYAPKYVSEPIRVFLDGVTLSGIWFLLHDYSVMRNQKGRNDPAAKSHRAFMMLLAVSLVAAMIASALFFLLNGYYHHYF